MRCCTAAFLLLWSVTAAESQTIAQHAAQNPVPAAVAAPKPGCRIDNRPPSDAEIALYHQENAKALDLFKQMAATSPDESRAGIIRTELRLNDLAAARAAASAWLTEQPRSAVATETMAEVLLRGGEPHEAIVKAFAARQLDPCNARALLTVGRVEGIAGLFASSYASYVLAHKLSPNDPDIHFAWEITLSHADTLKALEGDARDERLYTPQERQKMLAYVSKPAEPKPAECTLASTVLSAKVPIERIMYDPNRPSVDALDVSINGKHRLLEIDTGAGGILLTRAAGARLGLTRESGTEVNGLGDDGKVTAGRAHIASFKIGTVEFHNCPVTIIEQATNLGVEGLIGPDLFRKFLITLDYPKREMRLDELPKRPQTKPEPEPGKVTEAAAQTTSESEEPAVEDRYIAPEMEQWTRVYRVGRDLLLPVSIGGSRELLFLVDTGAGVTAISPAAAKEVTKVSHDDAQISGVSGDVRKVQRTGGFNFVFAHLEQKVNDMMALDLTQISHAHGIEISGLLGSPILYHLTVHLDYRDNLIKFDYDPKLNQQVR